MANSLGFESLSLQDEFEESEIQNLTIPGTMKYLSASGTKVMIIMRGVSGAGKSTIVNHLKMKFSTNCVCSADNYFMQNGVYRFDRRKLGAAHEHSHSQANSFCEQGKPVVIIDNTNVKEWETTFYVGLARSHGYVVFMITPAYQFKASANALAKRSTHGVDASMIREKLEMFSEITPRFFAWFFSELDSNKLKTLRDKALAHFKKQGHFQFEDGSEVKKCLHLTSIYLGRMADERRKRDLISQLNKQLGKVDEVKVIAIVITVRTVSARVALGDGAEHRYHNDTVSPRDEHPSMAADVEGYENLPKHHAAHITLATAVGSKAAEARSDTILSHLCEANSSENHHSRGVTYYPHKQLAVIKVPQPLTLSGIFAGSYRG